MFVGSMVTIRVFTPGGNETVLPSLETTKLFPVWTPDIVRVTFTFGGDKVAVAVAERVFVAFKFETEKLAEIWVTLMKTVRLSGVTRSGCWILGGKGMRKAGTNRIRIRIMTRSRKAHIGTGR